VTSQGGFEALIHQSWGRDTKRGRKQNMTQLQHNEPLSSRIVHSGNSAQ
jgi:hypothetical protein